jgi:CheY-like chemotaxis protein
MAGQILLVEDDENDELLTVRALKKSKLQNRIDVVRDGQEAVDYLFCQGSFAERSRDLPDMILLDLNLPKLNGLEVLKRIKADEDLKKVPVIMLTTSTEESDLVAAYTNGVNSYVQKPVDITDFMEAIQKLELYWFILNRRPGA